MATLDTKTKDPFAHLDHEFGDDFNARFLREDEIMDELQRVSDALPSPIHTDGKHLVPATKLPETMVGRILRFPYADGYAFYRVTSARPFKVQHLKYGDAWEVHPATIRGLTLVMAANEVARSLEWKAACERARAERS